MYLCYDVKGIQNFIFRVPKLKYIIGGSVLIDRFDREFAPQACRQGMHIFSAGGRGAFFGDDPVELDRVENKLREEAGKLGIDLRFGRNRDFSEAAHGANRLYPAIPSGRELDGHPCKTSGLYPVADTEAEHRWIRRRVFDRGDLNRRYFEKRLAGGIDLGGLKFTVSEARFFSSVARSNEELLADEENDTSETATWPGNRWAVICLDGNDMGRQFTANLQRNLSPEKNLEWIRDMSRALDECSLAAALRGCKEVIRAWSLNDEEVRSNLADDCCILPLRPLVVGGDDLAFLCHPAYALEFVQAAVLAFSEKSEELAAAAEAAGKPGLWPATGNCLTLSGGVLFAPRTLPLHTAVGYTELLQASAKSKGKKLGTEKTSPSGPSPSVIDWEHVTESMLDTPHARRQREMRFRDMELEADVSLTRRPYLASELKGLQDLAGQLKAVPRTIRHQVKTGLRTGVWERGAFVARIAKRQQKLAEMLAEEKFSANLSASRWKWDKTHNEWNTDLVDAIRLLEESGRYEAESGEGST